MLVKRQAAPNCNSEVTPACLQTLYGIPKDRATQQANTLSVAGFLGEYANRSVNAFGRHKLDKLAIPFCWTI